MHLTRGQCQAMDAADPLAPLRALFALPEDLIYLDGNSLGALPKATAGRIEEAIRKQWGEGLIRSWNDAGWVDLPQRIGALIATLIGAAEHSVVAADSTSINLFKVLAGALAVQAKAHPARRVIVSEKNNFPTDLYIAEGLCSLMAGNGEPYRLQLIDDRQALDAALAQQPALLLLTHVDYRTGAMHDMAALTARAHAQGVLTIWDLAHSAGAVPLNLAADQVDFAIGCGYKYLNGGPGAPAFVYVAPRHQAHAWQPLSGWFGHAAPFRFESTYRGAPGVMQYLAGTPPVLGMLALECGLETLAAARPLGGMTALRQKSLALAEVFVRALKAGPAARVLHVVTPSAPEARGSQISLKADAALGDGYALMQALIAHGVIGDFRAPDILRFGLTPLYVGFTDVFDAVSRLHQLVQEGTWDQARFHARAAVT